MVESPTVFGDLRVLDLSTRLSGAFCARLFGNFGAEVLLVEPPEGHALRHESPFLTGSAPPLSLLHAYANAGKRGLTLSPGDRAGFEELVREADVIVTTSPTQSVECLALNPAAVVVSVTPHGLTGPLAGAPGNDLTAYARTGWAAIGGDPDEPPLKGSSNQAGYLAGLLAFDAAAAAVVHRDRTGQGQLVDTSELEALALITGPAMLVASYEGKVAPRHKPDIVRGPVQARDGYISLTISRAQFWRDAMTLLGLPELANDQRYSQGRFRRLERDNYSPIVEARLQHWGRWELFDALARLRCVIGIALDTRDVVENPHLAARGFFIEAEIAPGARVPFPGPPFRMSETAWRLAPSGSRQWAVGSWGEAIGPATVAAPAEAPPDPQFWGSLGSKQGTSAGTGAHSSTPVRTESDASASMDAPATLDTRGSGAPNVGGGGAKRREAVFQVRGAPVAGSLQRPALPSLATGAPTTHSSPLTPHPPLRGVRAVVLTQAWSGTFATELLGLLGAEVIQVEARARPDSWRGDYAGVVPTAVRDETRRQRPWNTSGLYNAVNLNKRAITLDLRDPRGVELFKRLTLTADLVAENFTPRVMGNLGLEYESLRRLKPDIILASLSAYGGTGPYANIPGIGGTIEPMSGMSSLLGYERGRPQNSGQMYPDPVSGAYFAGAMIMALRHRERTGRGQYIDLGMMEATASFIGDALLEYAANGTVRGPLGNHHLRIAPHNIYPAMDGRWLALAAEDEAAWCNLAALLADQGGLELAGDPRFAGMAARKANEGVLDEAIAGWTREQHAECAAELLRGLGVAAAMVVDPLEAHADPQLRARGFFVEVDHPEVGRHTVTGVPWQLSVSPAGVTRAAPMLGEHTREALAQLLAVTDAEYEALVAAGISGDMPPD